MKHYILLLIIPVFYACQKAPAQQEIEPSKFKGEVPPTEVETVPALVRPFEYLIQGNGKVVAAEENKLVWQIGGQIARLGVKNGQSIKQGQEMASLMVDRLQLTYEKAKARHQERRLEFENQMMGFQQAEDQVKDNIRYTSGLVAAELELKEAKMALEQAVIRAPISGVVADMVVKKSDVVNAGDLLCLVYNPHALMIETRVIESELGHLKMGQEVIIKPLADREVVFRGRVEEINPKIEEKSGSALIKVKVYDGKGLVPGMNVLTEIHIPYQKNIVVPKQALVIRSGRSVVFTAEGGLAKWNYVTTGSENGREVEILEGLKEQQQVIITNNLQLAHDAPVKPLN
jgi:membrane fusion protein, multidrug efflux system